MTTFPQDPQATDEQAVLDEAEAVIEAEVEAEPQDEISMDALDSPHRMLLVHAHPDDETIGNGVTMARYAAAGAHVTLVTCTLGEEGEVLVPELAHLAAARDDTLGQHRIGELAVAMEALGVRDHRFLGGPGRYRDSGMMGEPSNDRPDAFWQADLDEAAGRLVEVIREMRPQVLITYDDDGGYGHPDHIQAHRVAMRGVELAADPSHGTGEPWQVDKVYWNAMPESTMRDSMRRLREMGAESFFDTWEEGGELPSFIVPDELVTTEIDGMEFVEAKLAAMRAHATQIQVDGPFFALSNNLGNEVWGVESYRIVHGDAERPETDLFAGVG